MRIRLTVNIGKADVAKYGLSKTLAGDAFEIKHTIGEELIKKAWAEEVAHETIKADPPKAEIQGVPKSDFNNTPRNKN